MKESILGRFSPSVLRVVALSCFMFFLSLGTASAQSYVSKTEAVQTVRTQLHQIKQYVASTASLTVEINPAAYAISDPQLSAKWSSMEVVYELLKDPNTDVKGAVENTAVRILDLGHVDANYYNEAVDFLKNLLSN